MISITLRLSVLQVEDGTWRIVLGGTKTDAISKADQPFKTREEALAAIHSVVNCAEEP
jgi:hypothetical protein